MEYHIILRLVISVLICVLAVLLFNYLITIQRREEKTRQEAFRQLSNCLNSKVSFDTSDIRMIFRNNSSLFPSYACFIEQYLLYLRENDFDGINNPDNINSILKSILNNEQASQPYGEIGEKERRSMLSIEAAVKDNDLKDKDLKRAKRVNAWSIPLAIISLVFTIITFFFGTRLSKKDFDELEKRLTTVIEQRLVDTASSDETIAEIENRQ